MELVAVVEVHQGVTAKGKKWLAARQESKQKFAREANRFLMEDCGFTYGQVTNLFNIAGPGQCSEAVELAQWAIAIQQSPREIYRNTGRYKTPEVIERILRGAEYIIRIGGIPNEC